MFTFFNRRKLLADAKRLGRWGETRCLKFLQAKGMHLLARNFLCKSGEIDLVMVDTDGTIVFVEVKTRADETFAAAETAVTEAKKNSSFRAARYFLATHGVDTRPCRFDVVTVILGTKGPARITHFQNAFVP